MIRIKKLPFLIALAVLLTVALPPPKASADGVDFLPNGCSNTYLDRFKWQDAVKANDTSTGFSTYGGVTDFDYNTSSYIMLRENITPNPNTNIDGLSHTGYYNRMKLFIANPGKKITLSYDNTVGRAVINTNDGNIRRVSLWSEPNDINDFKWNWTGSFSSGQFTVQTYTGLTTAPQFDATGYTCVAGAKNVNYSQSWTYNQYTGVIPLGTGSGASCGTTDIGCYISRIGSTIQNTISSGVLAVFNFIRDMFVPDTATIKSSFDDTMTTMTAKLGFLTYPITFLSTAFDAFNSSSSWCSTSSCTKDLGDVFGTNMTVNFGAIQAITPSIWTMITLAARGILVMALVIMVRNKWLEVMQR